MCAPCSCVWKSHYLHNWTNRLRQSERRRGNSLGIVRAEVDHDLELRIARRRMYMQENNFLLNLWYIWCHLGQAWIMKVNLKPSWRSAELGMNLNYFCELRVLLASFWGCWLTCRGCTRSDPNLNWSLDSKSILNWNWDLLEEVPSCETHL